MPTQIAERHGDMPHQLIKDFDIPMSSSVTIKWLPQQGHADGHVQILTTVDKTNYDPGDTYINAYTGVLSREEINQTIRTLRRARDMAYGKDS